MSVCEVGAQNSTKIEEYMTVDFEFEKTVDLGVKGTQVFRSSHLEKDTFTVRVVDSVHDYCTLMQQLFDFDLLRKLVARKGKHPTAHADFKFVFDGMNGVSGPYAVELF